MVTLGTLVGFCWLDMLVVFLALMWGTWSRDQGPPRLQLISRVGETPAGVLTRFPCPESFRSFHAIFSCPVLE